MGVYAKIGNIHRDISIPRVRVQSLRQAGPPRAPQCSTSSPNRRQMDQPSNFGNSAGSRGVVVTWAIAFKQNQGWS